jgi:probable O-glycosylation ligase (exosortase A-associated)
MYPLQNWLYGFGLSLRFNFVFSLATMLGYVFMKNKPVFKVSGLFVLVLVFTLHSGLGGALYGVYSGVWTKFEYFCKAILFFIFVVLLLRKKEHFEAILIYLCLALCFFGVMEGMKVLLSGGGHKIIGIHGPLGDNNKVALGLNMTIPLILYLITQMKDKYIKLALKGAAFFCVMAIIGTASRGGFIGLIFMAVYYWWKNGKKMSIIFSALLIAGLVVVLMPSTWFERMDTINNNSTEEVSPLTSRVTSWKLNYLAALDNPIVGWGFNSTAVQRVWIKYVFDLNSLDWGIDTPIPKKGYVAHSIYFEVLGNQGFVGLFMFLLIIFLTLSKIGSLQRTYYKKGTWQRDLLNAVRVSIATFCICGAALSAAYFELLYLLIAIVLCLEITAKTSENVKLLDGNGLRIKTNNNAA